MTEVSLLVVATILLLNISCSMCFNRLSNTTTGLATSYGPEAGGKGLATWYGPETGAGKAAACGWDNDSKDPPFNSMIAAGNSNIFLKGKGCGHCFQIFCSRKPMCTGKPITITVTDQCPGACDNIAYHFDLSGHAFGEMAVKGQEHTLRMLGQVDIEYKRTPCHYGTTKIAFKVDAKSNPNWFATAIEYTNGDGGLSKVEIASGATKNFSAMDNSWGAVWKKDIPAGFKPPFSFRLTSGDGKTVVANNAVPAGYSPGHKYSSTVNF